MKKNFLFFALISILFFSHSLLAANSNRFFLSGDGNIHMVQQKSGRSIQARYRDEKNQYIPSEITKIERFYGISTADPAKISLRFLEMLDYLQDHYEQAPLTILSGYRSPRVNNGLRNKGKLAASSSMHIEAAAADLFFQGIPSSDVMDFVKQLPCCGAGYYHGKHIHLDTGPKRWWDEKTSGTEKKEPQENEKIILLTQWDFYSPNEKIIVDFARVTDFPIGFEPTFKVEKKTGEEWKEIKNEYRFDSSHPCVILSNRKEIKEIPIHPVKTLESGRYRVKAAFCEKSWEKMPSTTVSNEFEIR